MAIDLENLTLAIRKTPDGSRYAVGFQEFGETYFFKFTIAEFLPGNFESNLALVEQEQAEKKSSTKK